jgi:hypothetical protein
VDQFLSSKYKIRGYGEGRLSREGEERARERMAEGMKGERGVRKSDTEVWDVGEREWEERGKKAKVG